MKVKLEAPPTFRWREGTLPIGLELRNTTDEPRTISRIRVAILADEPDRTSSVSVSKGVSFGSGSSSSSANRRPSKRTPDDTMTHGGYRYVAEVGLTLQPGETIRHVEQLPLGPDSLPSELSDRLPGWVASAGSFFTKLRDVTADTWYHIIVRPEVEGFSATSRTSRTIRHLKPGEFHAQWSPSFGRSKADPPAGDADVGAPPAPDSTTPPPPPPASPPPPPPPPPPPS